MKALRILRNVVLGLVGLVVLALVVLQIFLRPRVLTPIVNRVAAQFVDGGELRFSNVRASVLKDFPFLNFTLEDGAIVYPHDRYARYDSLLVEHGRFRMLQAGRQEEMDTLASFRRLDASLNLVNFLQKTSYDIRRAELDRPRIFAHYFDSTAANWDILRLGNPDDTSGKEPLPPIRLQRIRLTGRPYIVFTDRADTLLARVRMNALAMDGKLDTYKLPDARLKLTADSLSLSGRLPADTLSLRLDRLQAEGKNRRITLSADARASLFTRTAGRLRLPVHLDTDVSLPKRDDGKMEALVHSLALRVSTIDLKGSGDVVLGQDGTEIRADASIEKCPLGALLKEYQTNFPVLGKIRTDAVLDLEAHADGVLAEGRLPRLQAHLQVPDAYLDYDGLGRRGRVSVDVDAATDEDLKLDVNLNRGLVDIVGAHIDLQGTAADLTGENPFFSLSGKIRARVDSLTRAFTREKGITGTGSIEASVNGQARLSQLTLARIGQADIRSSATIRNLTVDDTRDGIRGFVRQADLLLETKGNKIDQNLRQGTRVLALDATLDTLDAAGRDGTYLRGKGIRLMAQNSAAILRGGKELTPLMGILKAERWSMQDNDGLTASLRDNSESFRVTPSTPDFKSPKLTLRSQSAGVRVRTGTTRALLRNLKFDVTANKRLTAGRDQGRRERLLDSLGRIYPGVPQDSLLIRYRRSRPRRAVPAWLEDSDFRKKDIRVSLSGAMRQYYRDWDFDGSLSLESGRFLTPAIPLRALVSDIRSHVTNDRVDLQHIAMTAGASDVTAQATLSNLRRSILGRGTIGLEATVSSGFLDVNELLKAYAFFRDYQPEAALESASDEAIEEAMAGAELPDSTGSRLLVIPSNLDAHISLEASGIRYDSLDVSWAAADLAMKQRTLQITNALAATNMGDIFFEGFYATRSKRDIKAAFDLRLEDVTAEKVITLFPAMDTLMPMLKSFAGDLNCELAATAEVDTSMHLVLPSIDGIMKISGRELSISGGSQEFQKIAKYLMFKNKKGAYVDGMTVNGMVRDNVLEVFPFVLDVDRYTLAASGLQHLDEAFNYHLSAIKSPLLVKFGVNVWGDDFDHVRYGLGRAKYRNVRLPDFTGQLDTVQNSLLASIHNVFELGVEKAIGEHNGQRYIQDRMEATGYSAADTLAAPASVTDSLTLMSRRFEEASAETDRQALKESLLEAVAGASAPSGAKPAPAPEPSPAALKKENDE